MDSSFYYLREDDIYFLIVRRTGDTPAIFERCVLSANEFGELVTSEEQYIAFVTEHGVCVAGNHAIEMFLNVIPGLRLPGSGKYGKKQERPEDQAGVRTGLDFRNKKGEA